MGRKTFSKEERTAVFRRADIIPGKDENQWRKDRHGKVICNASYGHEASDYGWNIHHIDGNSNNNVDSNLEAVHYDTHDELH